MGLPYVQNKFTVGELDPKMHGRSDLEQYYASLAKQTNLITLPQGGLRKRKGLRYIDRISNILVRNTGMTITAPNGGTTTNANDNNETSYLSTTTPIGTTNNYVVVHYDYLASYTFRYVDVANIAITACSSSEFKVQYSTDNTNWTNIGTLSLTTSAITKRFKGNFTFRYLRIVRIGTTNLSTATINMGELNTFQESTISETRLIDFAFNVDQTYLLVLSDQNIDIYEKGVYKTSIRALNFTSARLAEVKFCQSADTLFLFHKDVAPVRLVRDSSDDTIWTYSLVPFSFIPKYNFMVTETSPTTTLTPDKIDGIVKLTAGSSVFTTATVNQIIDGGGGRVRVLEYISGTEVRGIALIPFYSTTAIASGDWFIEGNYEDVWSSTRGYPKCGIFYEGRLWLGASKSRPTTLWASRVNDFYNFDEGSLYDDEAINATLSSDQLNGIENLTAQRTLQIFTTGSEWATISSLNDPITPTNVQFKLQTRSGSYPNLRVFESEGRTIFIQRGGKNVLSFVFNDVEQSYNTPSLTIFNSHLVKTPVDVGIRKSTSTDESTLYLMVNSDGTMTIGTVYISQNVGAFGEHTTDGLFKNVCADGTDIYTIVRRTINTVVCNYLEVADEDLNTDCAYYTDSPAASTTITGLTHLIGKEVIVKADGSKLSNKIVDSNGEIVIDRIATDTLEIGLSFLPYAKTLPIEIPSIGSLLGKKKRIYSVDMRLYETSDLLIKLDNRVIFRGFGDETLDEPPPLFTGDKNVTGLLGWTDLGQIEITQVDEMPMIILSLGLKVKV